MTAVWRRHARQTTDSTPDGPLVLRRERQLPVLDRFGVWSAGRAFCNVINTLARASERYAYAAALERPRLFNGGYVVPRWPVEHHALSRRPSMRAAVSRLKDAEKIIDRKLRGLDVTLLGAGQARGRGAAQRVDPLRANWTANGGIRAAWVTKSSRDNTPFARNCSSFGIARARPEFSAGPSGMPFFRSGSI